MRKLVLLLGLLVAFALSGAVMAQEDDLASVDPSGQTVIYWHQFGGAQGETIARLIEEFNSTNEWGITVEGTRQGSYNELRELINAGIISGELPNLVAGYANDAASYARDGAAVDLTPYLTSEQWGLSEEQLADFNQALLDANTVDGQLLAWPHQSSAQVMVYNQSMLEALGYDGPPTTFEEFIEVSCAASQMTGPNGEDVQGFPTTTDASAFESFVASRGGRIYHDGAFDFQSQAVLDTLQMYKDLYDQGCGYIPAEAFAEQTDFALGLNPYFLSSTAGLTFIVAAYNDNNADFEWNVTTVPFTEGNRTLQAFVPSIIMLPSTPEQQLASWLFLKFLVTPESAAAWSSGTGYFNPVPSSAELITEETFVDASIFPFFQTANELLNSEEVNVYSSPSVSAYGTVRGAISEALANVTTNGMSVEDAAAQLQQQADDALAESM